MTIVDEVVRYIENTQHPKHGFTIVHASPTDFENKFSCKLHALLLMYSTDLLWNIEFMFADNFLLSYLWNNKITPNCDEYI